MAYKDPATGKFTASPPIPETQVFANWRDVDLATQWRWPHFTPEEVACRGTGKLIVHASAMDKLEALRIDLGRPIHLNSAYRSPEHNKAVGGEPNSYHMATRSFDGEKVMAFDCSMENHEPYDFQAKAVKHGFRGFGHYPLTKDGKRNFMHIDNGPSRHWNLGGDFPRPSEKPVEVPKRFDAEPAKPTVLQTVTDPKVIGAVLTGASGIGVKEAVANPANPLAWAIAAILVVGIIGVGVYFFLHARKSASITVKGVGD